MSDEQDYTTPHSEPEVSVIDQQVQEMEQSDTASAEELNSLRERQAFERNVMDQGTPIPENFENASAWFDSLKEAQKQYTQTRQELADLRREYGEAGEALNPEFKGDTPAPADPEPEITGKEELRISTEKTEEVVEALENDGLTQDMWEEWGMELAATGELSTETKEAIKSSTNFNDSMIDDFVGAQKAKMRESYRDASKIIGGEAQLAKIFEWAGKNLSKEQQMEINIGLASPSYEVTLRGLAAMYDSKVTSDKAKEPSPTPNVQQVSSTETGYIGYQTMREFRKDRNNPRFNIEPKYRQSVEQRMMRTDFNHLPE
jgi:hypothetical protein